MREIPQALKALAAYNQFIIWIPVWNPKNNKYDKFPIDPSTGQKHNAHDPAIWFSAEQAIVHAGKIPDAGIGFVFTKDDPFWFFDLDKCLINGEWSTLAKLMCKTFTGCAVEVSMSGTGLHIFGVGEYPAHGCKNTKLGIEFYTEGRFVALTGTNVTGDIGYNPGGPVLSWLVNSYFPKSTVDKTEFEWTDEAVPEYNGIDDDDLLIEKMLQSKSAAQAFGNKASMVQLWQADENELGKYYPDGGGRAYDSNSADLALCSHLAFWCGKNAERIDRIFRRSALCRDKWLDREDYRYRTIGNAVRACPTVYTMGKPITSKPVHNETQKLNIDPNQVRAIEHTPILLVDDQIEYFKGCVYIKHSNTVFISNGTFLKPSVFKATYGGCIFQLDRGNDKSTTNAFEAFTESQGLRHLKADITAFRPLNPPGEILEEEELKILNTYIPIKTKRIKGDPAPFLGLMYKLFPIESDRNIVLAYASACIQHPGIKFQWCLLIQGMEGNGKSFLSTAIAQAIGIRYTHKPLAKSISNEFNAWVLNKLFFNIEEIYISDNREKIDALKPIITDSRLPVTPKGVDQGMGDNFGNLICNTNHKAGIRKTRTDRRWCVFYTPQQEAGDLERDGMGGRYFPDLYDWAREQDGYAIITDYLKSYIIPDELNPATTCHRAPITSSTEQALQESLTTEEQQIIESVEEGRPGFNGGWISSMALTRLFEKSKFKIPPNKWKIILDELGYIPHPGLRKGRVNSFIAIDHGKPRLYIKKGHIHANLQHQPTIIQHYIEVQQNITSNPTDAFGK